MKIKFEKPVTFSTLHNAFTGEGIPPIPENARCLKLSDRVVAYISRNGEIWECYVGNGTSQTSETYYWPTLDMCPRDWARRER